MKSQFSRVILVGCGGIARAHAKAVGAENIVALCDLNAQAARALQAELAPDAPVYTDFESALNSSHADAAIVCTPPTTHTDLVRRALLNDVAVLCEKPLATRAADANELVALSQSRAVPLRTSAKYRFVAALTQCAWPDVGALKNVRIAFGAPFDYARSWHANRALGGGGVWMDNGPHALDLARYFAGELTVCDVEHWRADGELETEVRVKLRSQSGVAVEIELSWLRALGDWFAVLEGANGALKLGWRETLWRPLGGAARVIAGGYDKAACFERQWRAFGDGTSLYAADGARVAELLEAATAFCQT